MVHRPETIDDRTSKTNLFLWTIDHRLWTNTHYCIITEHYLSASVQGVIYLLK